MKLNLISVDAFRKAPEAGAAIAKTFIPDVKAVANQERCIDFTISTGAVDRSDDTVNPKGWEVENYLKNPVVLFGHDYHSLPIGKAVSLTMEDGALKSRVQFTTKEENPMGDTVYRLIQGGFLKATSVGFKPIEFKTAKDDSRPYGLDFTKQELLEFSIVPVPANPEALIGAAAAGIPVKMLSDWALKLLETTEDVATKEKLIALAKEAAKVADDEKVAKDEAKAAADKAEENARIKAAADEVVKQLQADADAKAAAEKADAEFKAKVAAAVEEILKAKEAAPKEEKQLSADEAERLINAAVDAWELKNRGKLPDKF